MIDRIGMLINKGLHPEEVAMELEGIAPIEFIMEVALPMYKKRKYKGVNLEKPTNK